MSQVEGVSGLEPDLDLSQVFRIFVRRRKVLVGCVAATLLLGILFLAASKRKYRAEAQVQLLSSRARVSVPEASGAASATDDSPLTLTLTVSTYVGILESDSMALQVIRELDLEHAPEFRIREKAPTDAESRRVESLPLQETRFRREQILKQFKRGLSVVPVSGSRLIQIGYLSTNPELARKIVERLIADFVEYNQSVRTGASRQTEQWLETQIAELKRNAERDQQHAADLQRKVGIYGTEGAQNLTLSRLTALNAELESAELNRITKESVLQAVKRSSPEAISNLSGTSAQATSPGSINSLALLQNLRQQEVALSAQVAQLRGKFGPNYPRVIQAMAELAEVREEIAKESQRLTNRAQNDYNTAVEQEKKVRAGFGEQKNLAAKENDLAVESLLANREAASSRDLYEHLLRELKETGITSGMQDTSINVVDAAHVGSSPTSPNAVMVMAAALGAGLLIGVCAVLLVDGMDRSVRDPEDLQQWSGRPVLGVVPQVNTRRLLSESSGVPDLPGLRDAFRSMRTLLLRAGGESSPVVFLVTSASRGEGKTTVAMNLAQSLGQLGGRVLLVDADMRDRGLTELMGVSGVPGLSELLRDKEADAGTLVRSVGAVKFLPAGAVTEDVGEMLSSARCGALLVKLRESFDAVVVDSAAVLTAPETLDLSDRADAVVVVCRAGVTLRSDLERSLRLLQQGKTPVLGTVVNAADLRSKEFRSLYGSPAAVGGKA